MFLPKLFAVSDPVILHDLIEEESFGLILEEAGGTIAHVPVLLDRAVPPYGELLFHVSRANPIARLADGAAVQAIFQGPHGYISPQWYTSRQEVPTWNYTVVQARGTCTQLGKADLRRLLAGLAGRFEHGPREWSTDDLTESLFAELLGEIAGFSIAITSLMGKFKLSQNRRPEDQRSVLDHLRASAEPEHSRLLRWMERVRRTS